MIVIRNSGRRPPSPCLLGGKKNCRSLHYATPDFLSSLVALANFMRLSLKKAAHAAIVGAR
jgi:hypothetical protein